MASLSVPAHRSVSNIRPSAEAGSPSTPHRNVSATYGSPSALRAEEDCVVIELGNRYLRAGFAGEALPKAVVDYGPEEQRRAGDYRQWQTDHRENWRSRIQGKAWGEAHELWNLDLRDLDLGLVGDKLDRAIREAYTKFLLIDSRPRRVALAIPSALPLPLLSVILDTIFTNFHSPNISLMSSPALTTVAAGLRAALVVDIGWTETVVTSIYEYREISTHRSIRASKYLGQEMQKLLAGSIQPDLMKEEPEDFTDEGLDKTISFEECEEVTKRIVWCRPSQIIKPKESAPHGLGLLPVMEEDELKGSMGSMQIEDSTDEDPIVSIPLESSEPPQTLQLPFSKLAEPCEATFFASGIPPKELDDHEMPIHVLIYRSLMKLPVDVRSMCMSRIIIVGGGSRVIGLKARIIDEVNALIQERGWDPVEGRALEAYRNNPKIRQSRNKQASDGPKEVPPITIEDESLPLKIPANLAEQESDPIEDQIKREARKGSKPVEQGTLRAIESLGPWAGASLLSQLKVQSVSMVERESWVMNGISGASKSADVSVAASNRQSLLPGGLRANAGDRSSWTLGLWGT